MATTYPQETIPTDKARAAGAALGAAGLITVGGGLISALKPSAVPEEHYSAPFSSSTFVVVCMIAALSHALAAFALNELRRPAYIGRSKAAAIGVMLALAATVILIFAELAGIPLRAQDENETGPSILGAVFGLCTIVFFAGAVLAGRGAAREGLWRDGRRLLLLAWGIATLPLIVLGATDLFGYGLATWGIPMLMLGLALNRT